MSALDPSVPVHGLQPRGMDGETPPHATVGTWAPGLVHSVGAGNHVTALKPPHVAALAGFLTEDRGPREG